MEGLFTVNGSTVNTIATTAGSFTSLFSQTTVSDAGVIAFGAGGGGYFLGSGGPLTPVAKTFEGRPARFTSLAGINIDAGGNSLFVASDPIADRIIGTGDSLFGGTVSSVNFYRGLNNAIEAVFRCALDNGVSGIAVTAGVTEPSNVALLAAGVVCCQQLQVGCSTPTESSIRCGRTVSDSREHRLSGGTMSTREAHDTDELVNLAAAGSAWAVECLFHRHRARLRRVIAVRLDDRVLQRVDPSDVIQDTLTMAYRLLPDYLKNRPLKFYPWLREIAAHRLTDLHRRHVVASKRSVSRECKVLALPASEGSLPGLASHALAASNAPAAMAAKREILEKVSEALNRMESADREVLVLRHVEQLSVADTAAVLGVAEGTVKSRHFRALQRLRSLLKDAGIEGDQ